MAYKIAVGPNGERAKFRSARNDQTGEVRWFKVEDVPAQQPTTDIPSEPKPYATGDFSQYAPGGYQGYNPSRESLPQYQNLSRETYGKALAPALGTVAAIVAPETIPAQMAAQGGASLVSSLIQGKPAEETVRDVALSSAMGGAGQAASNVAGGLLTAALGKNPVLNRVAAAKAAAKASGIEKPVVQTSDVAETNPIMKFLTERAEEIPLVGGTKAKQQIQRSEAAQNFLNNQMRGIAEDVTPEQLDDYIVSSMYDHATLPKGASKLEFSPRVYDKIKRRLDVITDPESGAQAFAKSWNGLNDMQKEIARSYTASRIIQHNIKGGNISADSMIETFGKARLQNRLKTIFGKSRYAEFKQLADYLKVTHSAEAKKQGVEKFLSLLNLAPVGIGGTTGLLGQSAAVGIAKAYQGLPGQIYKGGAELGTPAWARGLIGATTQNISNKEK